MTKKRKRWQPTKYNKKYIGYIYDYLDSCKIEEERRLTWINNKQQAETYEYKAKVILPTIEWYCIMYDIPRRTVYEWRDKHEDFSHTLEEISKYQKEYLIRHSLEWTINSNITKLLLNSNHGMTEKKDITTWGKSLQDIKVIINDWDTSE